MGAKSPPPNTTHRLSHARAPSLSTHSHGPRSPVFAPPRMSRSMTRIACAALALLFVGLLAWRPAHVGSLPSLLPGSSEPYDPIEHGDVVLDLETHLAYTSYDGGVPGYSVFSNLYLLGGALTAVTPDAEAGKLIPATRAIMSGPRQPGGGRTPAGEDRWTMITDPELAATQMGKRAVRLPGITYIFNDPPGKEGYMAFWEHFISELIVPSARVIASVAAGEHIRFEPEDLLPTRIIFPRCTAEPSWRDDKGANLWFLQHALPGVIIEDATQWNDREANDTPYLFDRVIIVDRSSAHSAQGDTAVWGKMNMIVPTVSAPTFFWDPFRRNVIASIGDKMPHVGKYDLPVVVYIERPTVPKLSQASHEALVAGLKKLTKRAEVHIAQLRSMTKQQRISLMSRASILVGLSSDDLIEAVWMPPGQGAMVIELFEEGGFQRDIEALTSMLNLNYMAIQHDQVLTEAMWRTHGRKRGKKDGEVDVDGTLVARMIEVQLDRLK